MKNNIKKAPVKFREDLLSFQHFMLILSLPQISDYHHLNEQYFQSGCSVDLFSRRIVLVFNYIIDVNYIIFYNYIIYAFIRLKKN